MKIQPLAEVKARLSHYITECNKGPVIVTRNGRPAAALIPITDEDDLERIILAFTPRFRRLLQDASNRVRKKGGIKHSDFWEAEDGRETAE